jgi:hypothetical protein
MIKPRLEVTPEEAPTVSSCLDFRDVVAQYGRLPQASPGFGAAQEEGYEGIIF